MNIILLWDNEDYTNRQITQPARLARFLETAADREESRGNVEKAARIRAQGKPKLPWVTR
jgi:hypothetical protein